MQMRGRIKNKKVKVVGGGDITIISVLDSHNCGGSKFIASLKYSKTPMD